MKGLPTAHHYAQNPVELVAPKSKKWLKEQKLIQPVKGNLSTDFLVLDFHFVLHQIIQRCENGQQLRERSIIYLKKLLKNIQFQEIGIFIDGFAPKAKEKEKKRRNKQYKKRKRKHYSCHASPHPASTDWDLGVREKKRNRKGLIRKRQLRKTITTIAPHKIDLKKDCRASPERE